MPPNCHPPTLSHFPFPCSRRAQEADRLVKEYELTMANGGLRNHQILEQVQEKTSIALHQAQNQINHESNIVKTLTQRNRYDNYSSEQRDEN